MEKNLKSKAPQVQLMAKLFIGSLKNFGRLHEGSVIALYYMRTGIFKLFGYIPLGIKMLRTNRLALFPKRIKAHQSLSRIIRKAQEIEMRHMPEKLEYSPDYVGYKGLGDMKLEPRKGE
jgi:hypothetical protein